MLEENGINANYHLISIEDEFVKQAEVSSQLKKYKFDTDSIIEKVNSING